MGGSTAGSIGEDGRRAAQEICLAGEGPETALYVKQHQKERRTVFGQLCPHRGYLIEHKRDFRTIWDGLRCRNMLNVGHSTLLPVPLLTGWPFPPRVDGHQLVNKCCWVPTDARVESYALTPQLLEPFESKGSNPFMQHVSQHSREKEMSLTDDSLAAGDV